jgi:chorismate-pyruvate lyase
LTLYCANWNRRTTMQLHLAFADAPSDDDSLWEQLDPAAREAAIDRLAQAIAKVVTDNHPGLRENNDE